MAFFRVDVLEDHAIHSSQAQHVHQRCWSGKAHCSMLSAVSVLFFSFVAEAMDATSDRDVPTRHLLRLGTGEAVLEKEQDLVLR